MIARRGALVLAALAVGCGPAGGPDAGWDGGGLRSVAPMSVPRTGFAAFALADGTVVVAGGAQGPFADAGLSSGTERFDLGTGAWTSAGALQQARYRTAGALSSSGRPLLLGGLTAGEVATASVEAYQPDTRTWAMAGSLTTPRCWHGAAALPSGLVLVLGGYPDDGEATPPLLSAELYDPGSGASTPTAPMSSPRALAAIAAVPSGRVLVAGGCTDGPCSVTTAVVEIYQPDAGTWALAQPLPAGRFGASATALASGLVLVAGGCSSSASCDPGVSTEAFLYDPVSGARSAAAALPSGRAGHAALRLGSGEVLLVGGDNLEGHALPSLLYRPDAGTWRTLPGGAWHGAQLGLAPLPGGRALAAGGNTWDLSTQRTVAAVEVYEP